MLFIGDHTTVPPINNIHVVSIYSFREGFSRFELNTDLTLAMADDLVFDSKLAEFILNDNSTFLDFMSIIFPLYNGENVYMILNRDSEYFMNIAESIVKLIQQRYGYNHAVINEFNDYNYVESDTGFSLQGLYNFDIDRERYINGMLIYNSQLITNRTEEGVLEITDSLLYYPKYINRM